jgi:NitT/TauT family transport system ATP-binding protein
MITHDVEEAVFLSQRIYVLSARPGTIQQELTIELPENRNYKIKREPAFYHYTDTILDLLRSTNTEESETQISQNTDIL